MRERLRPLCQSACEGQALQTGAIARAKGIRDSRVRKGGGKFTLKMHEYAGRGVKPRKFHYTIGSEGYILIDLGRNVSNIINLANKVVVRSRLAM